MAISPTVFVSALRIIGSVGNFFKSRLERNYWSYALLEQIGVNVKGENFEKIYIATIYALINERGKERWIIRLFEIPDVRDAFKTELYERGNWSFKLEANIFLKIDPVLQNLKELNIIIDFDKEIEDFKTEFHRIVHLNRTPNEVEIHENLSAISEKLNFFEGAVKELEEKIGVQVNPQQFIAADVAPLVIHISRRGKIVTQIEDFLKKKGIVLLTGSISTGKTQLAAILFENYATQKQWVGLRHTDATTFMPVIWNSLSKAGIKIHSLEDFAKKFPENVFIVLDDLPRLEKTGPFNVEFSKFLLSLKEKNIRLLCTSNFSLPVSIISAIPDDQFEPYPIPFLDEEETAEILSTYGASSENTQKFKVIVHRISQGHPTITSAISKFLSEVAWDVKSEKISALFKNDYATDLTENTYSDIQSTVKDESTRELLYRLNLVKGTFTTDQVKIVSEITPAISTPIEKFMYMVGLWIQRGSENMYEVSPLVSRLKGDNVNSITGIRINLMLGLNILAKKMLSQFEASRAINYFLLARDFNRAGLVYVVALNASQKEPAIFFEWGFSLQWVYDPLPPEMDNHIRLQIRNLQLMLFSKKDEEYKDEIRRLSDDLQKIVREEETPTIAHATSMLFLSLLQSKENSSKALELYTEGIQVLEKISPSDEIKSQLEKTFDSEQIIWASTRSVSDTNTVNKWLDLFDKLPEAQKKKAIAKKETRMGAAFLTENLLQAEIKKEPEQRDWSTLLKDLDNLTQRAVFLKINLLIARFIKIRIIILNDWMKKPVEAKELADTWLSRFSEQDKDEMFLINNTIGVALFNNKDHESSIHYMATAVAMEVDDFYVEKLDSFLVMSRLIVEKDKSTAIVFTSKALALVKNPLVFSGSQRIRVAGEYAISLALKGEVNQAIYELEKGYTMVVEKGNNLKDHKEFVLKYGHVLNYYHSTHHKKHIPTIDGAPYEIPYLGYFFVTYTPDFVAAQWAEEREFIVSYLFLTCFEHVSDLTMAKKWATSSFLIDKALSSNAFARILQLAVPYYILNDEYNEGFECQMAVLKGYDKLPVAINNLTIGLKTMFDKASPIKPLQEYDWLLITGVIIPTTIRLLHLEIKGDIKELLKKAQTALERWTFEFKHPECIEAIKNMFTAWEQGSEFHTIIQQANTYKGEHGDSIKTIAYLITASRSNTQEAFNLHSALIKSLSETMRTIGESANKFLFLPYLESFWFDRIDTNTKDFANASHMRENGKNYYSQQSAERKPRALFKVLTNHLKGIVVTQQLENWIDE